MLSKRPFRFVRVSVDRAVQCAWFTCMYLCRSVACFVHTFLSTSKMVCACIYVGLCLVCARIYVGLCNEHVLCLFIKIYAGFVLIYVGLCNVHTLCNVNAYIFIACANFVQCACIYV